MKFLFALIIISGLLPATAGLYAKEKDIVENEPLLLHYLSKAAFEIDTSAGAVILYERGSSIITDGRLTFKVDRTVKILSSEAAADLGTIALSYSDNSTLKKISATTYNLDDGKIVSQSVERSEMISDQIKEDLRITKFNLPSVRKGSVIHYSYIKEQPGFVFYPEWPFQSEYPTLHSEYEVAIPQYLTCNIIERVNVPMVTAKKYKELANCAACYFDESYGTISYRTWVRKNIPAFEKEDYMGSADNYLERVKVQVTAIHNNGFTTKVFNNWKDFTRKYCYENNKSCGQAFARNNFLDKQAEALTAGRTKPLDKARAIYSFVRDHYTAIDAEDDKWQNIKTVFEEQKGSSEGINLLLTALLRKAGLNSAPVLLSTRNRERLNMLYPNVQAINGIVSMLQVAGHQYVLDASVPELPFGTLLPNYYNGYSRIVNESGDSIILDPDSLWNKTTIIASLSPAKDNPSKLHLKVQQQLGTFSAIYYRKTWQRDSTELKKEINARLKKSGLTEAVESLTVSGMNNPDEKLLITYEVTTTLDDAINTIYLNPYYVRFFDKNPYKATRRNYTVEREYKEDINYILNFQLPDDYTLDDYPPSRIYKLNEQGLVVMKNIMNYDESSRLFSLNSRFTTHTTVFSASEYETLRNFYEQIMGEQEKKIILKKKMSYEAVH